MSVVQGRGAATRKNFPLIHKRFLDFGDSDAEAFMPAGEGAVVEVVAVMGCHADREEKESDEGKHRESGLLRNCIGSVYRWGLRDLQRDMIELVDNWLPKFVGIDR